MFKRNINKVVRAINQKLQTNLVFFLTDKANIDKKGSVNERAKKPFLL